MLRSLTVVFGLRVTVDCFTKRPVIALRPRFPAILTSLVLTSNQCFNSNTVGRHRPGDSEVQQWGMAKTTVDPFRLHAALNATRSAQGVSWRTLAKTIGVSPSLLSRLGQGLRPDANSFATIVSWLNLPAEDFFEHEGEHPQAEPELMSRVAPLLRADKDLSDDDVKFISDIISATITRARAN